MNNNNTFFKYKLYIKQIPSPIPLYKRNILAKKVKLSSSRIESIIIISIIIIILWIWQKPVPTNVEYKLCKKESVRKLTILVSCSQFSFSAA